MNINKLVERTISKNAGLKEFLESIHERLYVSNDNEKKIIELLERIEAKIK